MSSKNYLLETRICSLQSFLINKKKYKSYELMLLRAIFICELIKYTFIQLSTFI